MIRNKKDCVNLLRIIQIYPIHARVFDSADKPAVSTIYGKFGKIFFTNEEENWEDKDSTEITNEYAIHLVWKMRKGINALEKEGYQFM